MGSNDDGQATPPAGKDYVAITANGALGLALKADGSIVIHANIYDPLNPPTGNDYAAIAAGGYHSLALFDDTTPPADPTLARALGEGVTLGVFDHKRMQSRSTTKLWPLR